MITTAEKVHRKIVDDAVAIANGDAWTATTFGSPVFKPGHDLRRTLTLTWDEGLAFSQPEIIDGLHQTGRRAVNQSIMNNQRLLVGLIVGFAKKGENYFDLFRDA